MKKILFITRYNPFEPFSGASQRTRLMLDALTEKNLVDLVCFTNDENKNYSKRNCTIKYFGQLNNYKRSKFLKFCDILKFYSIYSLFPMNKYAKKITFNLMIETRYDYIIIRYISTALMCGLKEGRNLVIDIDDLPEQWFGSFSQNKNFRYHVKFYYRIKSFLGKYYTRILMNNIYHSFLPNCSQLSEPNTSYLPNIPFPSINPYPENLEDADLKSYNVLIIGSMSYEPNYLGVDYFIRHIWGKIKVEVPEAVLNIAGRNLPSKWEEKWKKFEDVNYLGFVPDIIKEYTRNSVVAVPIYNGAGTNIKVLEAMKMRKATIISTYASRGFEGILKDSENILIAENDKDFVQKVVIGLKNKKFNKHIGENASLAIKKHFSYGMFAKIVHEVVN